MEKLTDRRDHRHGQHVVLGQPWCSHCSHSCRPRRPGFSGPLESYGSCVRRDDPTKQKGNDKTLKRDDEKITQRRGRYILTDLHANVPSPVRGYRNRHVEIMRRWLRPHAGEREEGKKKEKNVNDNNIRREKLKIKRSKILYESNTTCWRAGETTATDNGGINNRVITRMLLRDRARPSEIGRGERMTGRARLPTCY